MKFSLIALICFFLVAETFAHWDGWSWDGSDSRDRSRSRRHSRSRRYSDDDDDSDNFSPDSRRSRSHESGSRSENRRRPRTSIRIRDFTKNTNIVGPRADAPVPKTKTYSIVAGPVADYTTALTSCPAGTKIATIKTAADKVIVDNYLNQQGQAGTSYWTALKTVNIPPLSWVWDDTPATAVTLATLWWTGPIPTAVADRAATYSANGGFEDQPITAATFGVVCESL